MKRNLRLGILQEACRHAKLLELEINFTFRAMGARILIGGVSGNICIRISYPDSERARSQCGHCRGKRAARPLLELWGRHGARGPAPVPSGHAVTLHQTSQGAPPAPLTSALPQRSWGPTADTRPASWVARGGRPPSSKLAGCEGVNKLTRQAESASTRLRAVSLGWRSGQRPPALVLLAAAGRRPQRESGPCGEGYGAHFGALSLGD